jgi:hypothetical protein
MIRRVGKVLVRAAHGDVPTYCFSWATRGHGARAPLPTLQIATHTATSTATPTTISTMPDSSRSDSGCLNE